MPEHAALSQIDTEEGASAPTSLVIATATASGLSANVSYTAGGGAHATSLRLLWKIIGVDADFTHSPPVILAGQTMGPFVAGQTVEFKKRRKHCGQHRQRREDSELLNPNASAVPMSL